MTTKTLANLRDQLSMKVDDYLHSTVTTAISSDTLLVDTALANERNGTTDDAYNNWFALITSLDNSGENRIIADYDASATALTLQGINLSTDGAAKATYEIHRFDPDIKTRCINEAGRELYPVLFKSLRDRTLITDNWLYNGSFEDWDSSTVATSWVSASSALATATNPIKNGVDSATLTASSASGSMYQSDVENRRLADLAGEVVTFEGWAYPEMSADAYLKLSYNTVSGGATVESSTASTVATKWNFLQIKDYSIPAGATNIKFAAHVLTNAKYVTYDNLRVFGPSCYEYRLPTNFQSGKLLGVSRQVDSLSINDNSYPCDNYMGGRYANIGFDIKNEGSVRYLTLDRDYGRRYLLELEGYMPLEDTLTADTDTMTIDDPYTELIVAYAAMLLFEKLGAGSPWDSSNYFYVEYSKWQSKMLRLKRTHRMTKPAVQFGRSL